jgi:integrase
MARRPKNTPPTYRHHKSSGQAIVSLPRGDGSYKDVLLGRYGSASSRAEYARIIAEFEANGGRLALAACTPDCTVNELSLAFLPPVEEHYRDPDGKPTSEVSEYKLTLRSLRELYGHTAAAAFGPLALVAVRDALVKAGLSRGVINQRIGRIKRLFRWGVKNELVPPSVLEGLRAVDGLQRGRTKARETEPVKPVSPETVDSTLPHLTPPLQAVVELLRLTGMRPGECCLMRRRDIDMAGPIWLYTPRKHKTAWRGLRRVVAIGPKAQTIIRSFLKPDLDAYLFSPRDAMITFWQQQRAARRSKVSPGDVRARKRKLAMLGERYTVVALGQAIDRACERAFPPPAELARRPIEGKHGRKRRETDKEWQARLGPERWKRLQDWVTAHHWHPNQLRHLHATEVRRRYGIEAASTALGHEHLSVTEIYAERNVELARRIAAEIG